MLNNQLESKIRQLFKNRSDCYADMEDDSVVMAMSEDGFIDTLTEAMTIVNDPAPVMVPEPMIDLINYDSPEVIQRLEFMNKIPIYPITRRERRLLKRKKK